MQEIFDLLLQENPGQTKSTLKKSSPFGRQTTRKDYDKTAMPSRLGATFEQMKHDVMTGIEGKDLVGDTVRGFRNAFIALWHGANGVLPSIANSFNGQQFSVVQRRGGLDGTKTSIKKIFQTKGIVGKASAILFEATDGPVDDALALTGGAQWMIVPQTRLQAMTALAKHSEPWHSQAA